MKRSLHAAAWALALAAIGAGVFVLGKGILPRRVSDPGVPGRGASRLGAGEPPTPAPALGGSPAAALRALPYVDGTFDPDSEARGVLVFDRERAWPGLNFWASRLRGEAYLADMEGRLVHRWALPGATWNHVELLPEGDLLAVVRDEYLVRLDARSRVLWRRDGGFHHDLWVLPDGRIYALSRRALSRPEIHPRARTLVDFVTVLTPRGEVVEEISILDLLERSAYAAVLPDLSHLTFEGRKVGPDLDLLHTNHVEVFDGSLGARSPLLARGNLLLSMREIDAIAIVDGARREVAWLWGPGELRAQHHPTLLPEGRILLFDNGEERSRVLEVDPLTGRIVWSYGPREGFFSATRGSNQRLPNGNTLITESDRGYAFEVTRAGETVWKFANPEVDGEGKRMAIWRLERFAPEELPFLAALAGDGGG